MMYVCVFAGVSALFCYLLGINYMTRYYGITHANINTAGVFSGITTHSMMLGPVSAMGLVYLIYWATKEKIQPKIKGLSLLGVALSGCAILLSASRISLASALTGIAVVILLRFKYKIIKLIGVILCSIIVLILTFPLYKPIAMPMIEKQANNLDTGGTFHSREDRWGHRLSEFGSSPMFGIGFSAVDTQYKGEYSASHGFIEPGSSWLAVLSMLGLFGTLPIAYILIVTIVRLKRIYSRSIEDYSILLLGLLSVFFVHLIAEGYILAGGSFLCYLFWLTLGVSYSYSRIDLND